MVYPRLCGGTARIIVARRALAGLSPLVRGNQPKPQAQALLRRSIPACAGEPGAWGFRLAYAAVYPRLCGGTIAEYEAKRFQRGLSPLVRGNPLAF